MTSGKLLKSVYTGMELMNMNKFFFSLNNLVLKTEKGILINFQPDKLKTIKNPAIFINTTENEKVDETKSLGLKIDNYLST